MKTTRILAAGIAWLFVAAVAYQVFLAGVGLLGGGTMEGHVGFGYLIPLIALVELIVVAAAQVKGTTRLAGLLLGLTAVQIMLAYARFDTPSVAALHPVNALFLWLVAVIIARRLTAAAREPEPRAAIEPSSPATEPVNRSAGA
jgi:hypothetical protein